MRFLAFFCVTLFCAAPFARAEEVGLIKITRDDGSVSEYKITDEAVNEPVSIEIKRKQEPETVEIKEAKEKETRAVSVVKKSAEKKPVKQSKLIVPPLPDRKPLLQPKIMKLARELPDGVAIPKNIAVAIAIKHAPPSKDFKVSRRMYGGVPVYAVVFESEEGSREVLVDARNGEIVKNWQ